MIRKLLRIRREEGTLVLRGRLTRFARRRLRRGTTVELPVAVDDVLAADWAAGGPARPSAPGAPPARLRVDWVIPAIGAGAGGHGTILRFVRALERSGHECRLFVYDPHGYQTGQEARAIARRHFPPMRARIHHGVEGIGDCDALIATAWQTAYPVFNARTSAGRFYFVQDHEPSFHPAGSVGALAEATYRFGLHGITAGGWLAEKLRADHGMACDAFAFGSDPGVYRMQDPPRPRGKVLFYARPATPRRGFELGTIALALLAREHPELEITMVGADVGAVRLPFAFVNRGILTAPELNALYNEAAAGLVLSFTNLSLLPLELLAAGCIPVVNDAACNRGVSANPHIAYRDPSPHALARALCEIVEDPDGAARARAASQSVQALGWERSEARVEQILRERLRAPAGPRTTAAVPAAVPAR